uniref:C-type lectin domain-containing protein n=1 Tax=Xiphophorus maculatus TaxID=8083 RepID=M4A0G9_XIPMA
MSLPDRHPDGFKRSVEHAGVRESVPAGFRQGTEPSRKFLVDLNTGLVKEHISEMERRVVFNVFIAFRQGTEPKMSIPTDFRQGTEPEMSHLIELRKEAQQNMQVPVAFRQATRAQTHKMACNGEIISGKCYEFNPNSLSYKDAFCRNLAPDAELASITNRDLHSRLVSLVTKGGENDPVLTWLGGIVKNQQASWVDGSKWSYSDWMPGHPNIHTDKPACVEMFKIDESWWSVADCELKRASLCSYPVTA